MNRPERLLTLVLTYIFIYLFIFACSHGGFCNYSSFLTICQFYTELPSFYSEELCLDSHQPSGIYYFWPTVLTCKLGTNERLTALPLVDRFRLMDVPLFVCLSLALYLFRYLLSGCSVRTRRRKSPLGSLWTFRLEILISENRLSSATYLVYRCRYFFFVIFCPVETTIRVC